MKCSRISQKPIEENEPELSKEPYFTDIEYDKKICEHDDILTNEDAFREFGILRGQYPHKYDY